MSVNEFSGVLSCWFRLRGFPRLIRLRTSLLVSMYMDKDYIETLINFIEKATYGCHC